MAKEQKLEAAIVNYARERGVLVYKFTSPAHKGVPDRILIFPTGIVLFMEIKAPGKKITPLQAHTIEKMIRQGCLVAVVDNLAAAFAVFDTLANKKNVIADK